MALGFNLPALIFNHLLLVVTETVATAVGPIDVLRDRMECHGRTNAFYSSANCRCSAHYIQLEQYYFNHLLLVVKEAGKLDGIGWKFGYDSDRIMIGSSRMISLHPIL